MREVYTTGSRSATSKTPEPEPRGLAGAVAEVKVLRDSGAVVRPTLLPNGAVRIAVAVSPQTWERLRELAGGLSPAAFVADLIREQIDCPTPEQIKAICAEIQAAWTPAERENRKRRLPAGARLNGRRLRKGGAA